MKEIKSASKVFWPGGEIQDAFTFSTLHPDGVFNFTFRWFNERWNCWVELPSGELRAVGVLPLVPSWTGFLDYGLIFSTQLPVIDRDSLLSTELYILNWM